LPPRRRPGNQLRAPDDRNPLPSVGHRGEQRGGAAGASDHTDARQSALRQRLTEPAAAGITAPDAIAGSGGGSLAPTRPGMAASTAREADVAELPGSPMDSWRSSG
jgi:hypothetical protein